MTVLNRRRLLQASAASAVAMPALAQNKPEKLIYVGDNGPWHWVMVDEVGPAFKKETGIEIDFTLLPVDPWNAKLKAELGAGSDGIDIVQWSVGMAGWISPYMDDHEEVAAKIVKRDPAWDWGDFLGGSKTAATYDGKLSGIPYRVTTGIMHYQKALLDQAGITRLPETFAELEKAVLATNKPPERFGFGVSGKQGPAIFTSFISWLYSSDGRLADFKTGEIFINDEKAVAGLQFWIDLIVKDKATPPEAMTWEYDEIVAGGQNDKYAMCQTFAPYVTLMNDPKISKTGGKWVSGMVPGRTSKEQGRTWVDGHFLGVPKFSKQKDWAIEFIRMVTDKKWMARSMERGNAPPRGSVLRNPEIVAKFGWPAVAASAIETGIPTPNHPAWLTLQLPLRAALSQAILGQKTAKQALDDVASDWQRGMRRAGIGKG
jgi:multiple sugar transport system substrate-binding protein